MNLDLFFEETNKKLDEMTNVIGTLCARVKTLPHRLEASKAQSKKGVLQRDGDLEADFNDMAKNLKIFADDNELFWTDAKEKILRFNRKEMAADYVLQIKILNNNARLLTHRIEELQKDFSYITPLAKTSDLKLDVFLFDYCLSGFEKIISKILYISRDLTRLINKERY